MLLLESSSHLLESFFSFKKDMQIRMTMMTPLRQNPGIYVRLLCTSKHLMLRKLKNLFT